MKKCSWCQKEMETSYCDYWDFAENKWRLELCEECHNKRFQTNHILVNLVAYLKDVVIDIERKEFFHAP